MGRRSGPGQPVGSLAPSSTGEIVAGSERGTVTDIRGVLHDVAGRIRRRWKLKRWPLGRLEFHGGRRVVTAPEHYRELFLLDKV
jgi:hypothetical protein